VDRAAFENPPTDPKVIGVDVARFGNDSTVITTKHGGNARVAASYKGKDLNWTISKIKELDEEFKSDRIVIDDTGVGGGVTDALKGWMRKSDGKSPDIVPVNFGAAPTGIISSVVEFKTSRLKCFGCSSLTSKIKRLKSSTKAAWFQI